MRYFLSALKSPQQRQLKQFLLDENFRWPQLCGWLIALLPMLESPAVFLASKLCMGNGE
jgi:hypothetical protein